MVLWLLADQAGFVVADPPSGVVPSATPLTRHRIGERFGVRARSVLGGLHHEYLLVPALV
jgi:hypothetical protein